MITRLARSCFMGSRQTQKRPLGGGLSAVALRGSKSGYANAPTRRSRHQAPRPAAAGVVAALAKPAIASVARPGAGCIRCRPPASLPGPAVHHRSGRWQESLISPAGRPLLRGAIAAFGPECLQDFHFHRFS
jgi:hypothetical protein